MSSQGSLSTIYGSFANSYHIIHAAASNCEEGSALIRFIEHAVASLMHDPRNNLEAVVCSYAYCSRDIAEVRTLTTLSRTFYELHKRVSGVRRFTIAGFLAALPDSKSLWSEGVPISIGFFQEKLDRGFLEYCVRNDMIATDDMTKEIWIGEWLE